MVARVADNGSALWMRRSVDATMLSDLTLVDVVANADEAALLITFGSATGFDSTFDSSGGGDVYIARLTL